MLSELRFTNVTPAMTRYDRENTSYLRFLLQFQSFSPDAYFPTRDIHKLRDNLPDLGRLEGARCFSFISELATSHQRVVPWIALMTESRPRDDCPSFIALDVPQTLQLTDQAYSK